MILIAPLEKDFCYLLSSGESVQIFIFKDSFVLQCENKDYKIYDKSLKINVNTANIELYDYIEIHQENS